MEVESQNGTYSYKVSKEVSFSTTAEASQINRDFDIDFPYNGTIGKVQKIFDGVIPK